MSPRRLSPVIFLCGLCAAIHSASLLDDVAGAVVSGEQCGWPSLSVLRHNDGRRCPRAMDDSVGSEPSSWAPWTHRPYCADTNYCVFTNSMFQGNHGVSIITTPENAASSVGLHSTLNAAQGSRPSNIDFDPPYVIKEMPGMGMGVIATRKIAHGEILMIDYTSVLVDTDFPGRVRRDKGHELLQRAMEQLPNSDGLLSLARSSTSGAPIPEDVMRTNTFGMEISDRARMALFPVISRINHACKPNAYTRFSEQTLTNRVMAFRDIEAGEEITISYIEPGLTYAQRQKALRRWGFDCECSLCSASAGEIAGSDRRRLRVLEIREQVLNHVQRREFHGAIALNEEMVDLILKEGLAPHLGEHYEVLARLYLAATDLKNAKKFAELALIDMEANGGEEVYDGAKELKIILGWNS